MNKSIYNYKKPKGKNLDCKYELGQHVTSKYGDGGVIIGMAYDCHRKIRDVVCHIKWDKPLWGYLKDSVIIQNCI